jgi:hypothetical protein
MPTETNNAAMEKKAIPADPVTITSVASTTFSRPVLHEAVGHGGACLWCVHPMVVSPVPIGCSVDDRLVTRTAR